MWEDAGALLLRFFLDGPVMYIALVMALDPEGFVRSLEMISIALRNFQHRVLGRGRTDWWREEPLTWKTGGLSWRLAGWCLVAVAFLHLAGVLEPRI
jgi:hypothetical protein